jgi:L-ascorbate metabolism protein UlaG (beta-lactamase superfamily)
MDGVKLVTDPLLRSRMAHLVRAAPAPAVALHEVDPVLVSHGHYDHLDPPTLARIGHGTPIVVAAGSARMLRRRGYRRVFEVATDDRLQIGGLCIHVIDSDHAGGG